MADPYCTKCGGFGWVDLSLEGNDSVQVACSKCEPDDNPRAFVRCGPCDRLLGYASRTLSAMSIWKRHRSEKHPEGR